MAPPAATASSVDLDEGIQARHRERKRERKRKRKRRFERKYAYKSRHSTEYITYLQVGYFGSGEHCSP
jgi:hypothetical protein